MNTYRIAEHKTNAIRFDLPEFASAEEAHDFVRFELMDWNEVNLYVTAIQSEVNA